MIRDVADKLLDGESLRQVTRWLDAQGVKTTAGNRWSPTVVRRMMMAPRLAGLKELPPAHRNVFNTAAAPAPWPAILSAETHGKLVHLLGQPSRQKADPSHRRTYLLTSGVTVCGLCGTALVARPAVGGKRGYVCPPATLPAPGCGRIRVQAEAFEHYVATEILARIAATGAEVFHKAYRVVQQEAEDARAKLIEVEQLLTDVGAERFRGGITSAEYRGSKKALEGMAAEARRTLARAQGITDVPDVAPAALAQWWAEATMEQRRGLVVLTIEKVVAAPNPLRGGHTFNPNRVTIHWR